MTTFYWHFRRITISSSSLCHAAVVGSSLNTDSVTDYGDLCTTDTPSPQSAVQRNSCLTNFTRVAMEWWGGKHACWKKTAGQSEGRVLFSLLLVKLRQPSLTDLPGFSRSRSWTPRIEGPQRPRSPDHPPSRSSARASPRTAAGRVRKWLHSLCFVRATMKSDTSWPQIFTEKRLVLAPILQRLVYSKTARVWIVGIFTGSWLGQNLSIPDFSLDSEFGHRM